MSKLNKNVLFALTVAFLGLGNISKAEDNDALMNHRLVAKVGGAFNIGPANEAFKKITGEEKKSDNFKWSAGGSLEYDYFFNTAFGVGLDFDIAYQQLWKFDFNKKNTGNDATSSQSDANKADKDQVISFGGVYLAPSIKFLYNFLEDGLIFDEENEEAAGSKFGIALNCGYAMNFGCKNDYKKVNELNSLGEENQAKLTLGNVLGKVGVFFELPMGFGAEVNYKALFGKSLEVVKAAENNNSTNSGSSNSASNDNNDKSEKFRQGVEVYLFYNLGNFFN